MDNPFKVFDEIRRAYVRYLDSPFRLRYDVLLDERKRLLDTDRQLYRDPLFEPVPVPPFLACSTRNFVCPLIDTREGGKA